MREARAVRDLRRPTGPGHAPGPAHSHQRRRIWARRAKKLTPRQSIHVHTTPLHERSTVTIVVVVLAHIIIFFDYCHGRPRLVNCMERPAQALHCPLACTW